MRLKKFVDLPKKTQRALISKEVKFDEWQESKKAFARGRLKVAYDKEGRGSNNRFFDRRGNMVLRRLGDESSRPAIAKFYEMKIIHALFPENVPRIRGVEELANGALLHFDKVPLNPELKSYMDLLLQMRGKANVKTHNYDSHEFMMHHDMVRKNQVVRDITCQMRSMGLDTHSSIYSLRPLNIRPTGNESNVSVANPRVPVFFEPRINSPRKLRRRLRKMQLPEAKRAQLLHWLERYETLMEESYRIN
jgi:hypothetical protein